MELVARDGWRLLPYYQFDTVSGVWRFQGKAAELVAALEGWSFTGLRQSEATVDPEPLGLEGHCELAESELTRMDRAGEHYELALTEGGERLRWFLLPQEAAVELEREQALAS